MSSRGATAKGEGRTRTAANRTPPTISQRAVNAWTKGNAPDAPRVAYHFGSEENLASIRSTGANVAHGNASLPYYGRGFYMYAQQRDPWGNYPGSVSLAVRMSNPLVLHNDRESDTIQASFIQSYLAAHPHQTAPTSDLDPLAGEIFTREALARGYDGIIVKFAPSGGEVVAIRPGSVRVIVPNQPRTSTTASKRGTGGTKASRATPAATPKRTRAKKTA